MTLGVLSCPLLGSGGFDRQIFLFYRAEYGMFCQVLVYITQLCGQNRHSNPQVLTEMLDLTSGK